MKTTESSVREAIKSVKLKDQNSINEAVHVLISEGVYVKSGDSVAIIDDPTHALAGQKATVKGELNHGMIEVELANGVKSFVQANLLLKI